VICPVPSTAAIAEPVLSGPAAELMSNTGEPGMVPSGDHRDQLPSAAWLVLHSVFPSALMLAPYSCGAPTVAAMLIQCGKLGIGRICAGPTLRVPCDWMTSPLTRALTT
jgi:hypothetical protein